MIAQPEPESRLVSRMTLAPFARHWSACERCLWASPSAFTTVAVMFAFLKAAMNVGRSCVSHLTDDFVSGSRTHASALAAACLSLPRERRADREADGQHSYREQDDELLHSVALLRWSFDSVCVSKV